MIHKDISFQSLQMRTEISWAFLYEFLASRSFKTHSRGLFWSHVSPSVKLKLSDPRSQIIKGQCCKHTALTSVGFLWQGHYMWPGGIVQKDLLSHLTQFFSTEKNIRGDSHGNHHLGRNGGGVDTWRKWRVVTLMWVRRRHNPGAARVSSKWQQSSHK